MESESEAVAVETVAVKFVNAWGDYVPGEKRSLPAPFARHMVACGCALFIPAGEVPEVKPAAPVVERATKKAGGGG